MRHTAGARRELGVATVFNFLGPLTNPAGATRQALGVSDPRMLDVMVETLGRLGSAHVLAFHGHQGIDELATSGPSQVVELRAGEISRWVLDPAALGLPPAPLEALKGGSAPENAAVISELLKGERGPRRDVVALNAAAALVAAELVADVAEGLERAGAALDSGAAAGVLERLVEVSNTV